MGLLGHLLSDVSNWMRPYLFEISMALVVTVISMFSSDMNKYLKRRLNSAGFLVRFGVFVLLSAFGYGMMSIALARVLEGMFAGMNGRLLSPMIVLAFLGLALLAERKNQV